MEEIRWRVCLATDSNIVPYGECVWVIPNETVAPLPEFLVNENPNVIWFSLWAQNVYDAIWEAKLLLRTFKLDNNVGVGSVTVESGNEAEIESVQISIQRKKVNTQNT